MFFIIVLLAVVAYIFWYTMLRKSDLPPGPLKLPFIGNIWWFILQKWRNVRIPMALCEADRTHGDIIHFQAGTKNIVFLQGFDAINEAFVKQTDDFNFRPNRGDGKKGSGVVWENGKPFEMLQSIIMKALNSESSGIEKKILEEIKAAMDHLDTEMDRPFDISHLLTMMITNIIYNFIFGKRFDYADDALNHMIANLGIVFQSGSQIDATAVIPKFILKLVKGDKIDQDKQEAADAEERFRDQVNKEISEHRETFNEDRLRDFVDVFIKEELRGNDDIFTQERLFNVIRDLLVAGSEATAVTMNWIILYMQEYPELQNKCQRELQAKCGERSTCMSDKGSLPFNESTVMEIQRMASVAETSLPHTVLEDTTFRSYRIPKDSVVLANLLSSNKDKRYWDDPDTFIPERFLQEGASKIAAFLPFGLGRRKCLGDSLAKKEIFLMVTNFLQRYTFQKEDPNTKHSFGCIVGRLAATPLPYKTRIIKRQ